MPDQQISILVCVSDVHLHSRISGLAGRSSWQIHTVDENSSSSSIPPSSSACLLVHFEKFHFDLPELIGRFRNNFPQTPIIAILGSPDISGASRLLRAGAFECLAVSSTDAEFCDAIERSCSEFFHSPTSPAVANAEPWRRLLVGESTGMDHVTRIIRLVAQRRCTVLIGGETGTGKEMAARAIHLASDRARKPLVAINCGAIPENLMEAELFGHVKGAFTGAVNARVGRFEQANGGTLFLDEIGDLPFELQAKLLRVLQEREIQRLGSSETVKVDVRVIAATNADLLARVRNGTFREDLYYRLNVVPIAMPALRDRCSDIPLLARHFVEKVCQAEGLAPKDIAPQALSLLATYNWPGNVRQLENVVEHAVVMSGDRLQLFASDFSIPASLAANISPALQTDTPAEPLPDHGLDFTETLRRFERGLIQQALSKAQGNKTLAADMLRLPRTTLLHKLRVLDPVAA